MKKNILIIAGEPSGDVRAGALLKELRGMLPDVHFWGIGGDRMEQQGAELVEHIRGFSMVGVWEVLRNLSKIHKQYRDLTEKTLKKKPALAILVDYPGFNLRVAGFLHRQNIPVVYYIMPQVWAWGRHRIRNLKNHIDKALVLFEFEKTFLEKYGIDCEFVGHPLVDEAPEPEKQPETGHDKGFTIALLPGSRKSEIINIFPAMLDAAQRITRYRDDVRFIVAENSNIDRALYDSVLAGNKDLAVSRITDDTFTCLARCDFAMVTSGTATLETAIMEKPMLVTYRGNFLCYLLMRLAIRIPFLGLVNIIAGKEVSPELIQDNATAEKLAGKTLEIINDPSRMEKMKEELRKIKHSLGEKGASRRAAEAITRFVRKKEL